MDFDLPPHLDALAKEAAELAAEWAARRPFPEDGWLIGHDLYVWSPKGFFTGSPTTPGSILLGYHFERADVSCKNCTGGSFGLFNRNRILLNEWGLAYFFAPRMSVLGSIMWYDASNLPATAMNNLGFGNRDPRKGGDWVDGSITLRVSF